MQSKEITFLRKYNVGAKKQFLVKTMKEIVWMILLLKMKSLQITKIIQTKIMTSNQMKILFDVDASDGALVTLVLEKENNVHESANAEQKINVCVGIMEIIRKLGRNLF